MQDSYLAECLEKFHELPEQLQELIGGFDACLKIKKIEDFYGVSLSFVTILVAIGELSIDDLVEYLNLKFSLDKRKGLEVSEKLEEEIFTPALKLIIENLPPEDELIFENNSFGLITDLSASDKKELIIKTSELLRQQSSNQFGYAEPMWKKQPCIIRTGLTNWMYVLEIQLW